MKIAVTSTGPGLDDRVEARFGRCAYFVLIDTDSMQFESIENPNIARGGGAGIQSAQLMSEKGVTTVLTGNCGPNAFSVFGQAGIQVIVGVSGTVRSVVEQFKAGKFSSAGGPSVQSHFGVGSPEQPGRTPPSESMNPILELDRQNQHSPENKSLHSGGKKMRIAVPLAQGKLSLHFGHCDRFAIFDIDENLNKVIHRESAEPASRAPGMLPKWLCDNNVNVVIAGGMGRRAQQLLAENNIQVIIGAASGSPEELVAAYLEDRLRTGENICDH